MSIELLLWTHITLLFLKNQINDNIVNLCIKTHTHTHTNEEEPKKKKKKTPFKLLLMTFERLKGMEEELKG